MYNYRHCLNMQSLNTVMLSWILSLGARSASAYFALTVITNSDYIKFSDYTCHVQCDFALLHNLQLLCDQFVFNNAFVFTTQICNTFNM